MNNRFYSEFQKHYNDFRKREALKWFNDNYFVALYTKEDEYITCFENVEEISNFFNVPVCKVLERIRNDQFIVYKNNFCKLYLVKKEIEKSISR